MNLLNLLKPSRWIARCHHNWVNPFATVYFNFHYLPLKQAVKLPIWLYGRPNLLGLKGKVEVTAPKIWSGMVKLNPSKHAPYFPQAFDFINDGGTIRFGGRALFDNGGRIHVFGGGLLEIGDDCRVNCSVIGCQDHIFLGNRSWLSNHTAVLDTNYHLLRNVETGEIKSVFAPIHIGSDVMVFAQSFIGKGCTIADHCVVSSYTHMKRPIKDMQPYSLIAGDPAQVVKVGYEIVYQNGEVEAAASARFKQGEKRIVIPVE